VDSTWIQKVNKKKPKGMPRWKWHEQLKREEKLARKKEEKETIRYDKIFKEAKRKSKKKRARSPILTKENAKDLVYLIAIIGFMVMVAWLHWIFSAGQGPDVLP